MAGQRQSADFTIEGLPELEARLDALVLKIHGSAFGAIMKIAYEVVNEAKGFCPVDTGRLRASIDILEQHPETERVYVLVGTTVDYAIYVEYGTVNGPMQPFMRPALHRAEMALIGEVAPIIRHEINSLKAA